MGGTGGRGNEELEDEAREETVLASKLVLEEVVQERAVAPTPREREKNTLLHSARGNEAGSIERLIDGDKRIIATKHLLPENNINVVVRVRPLSNKEIKSGDEMAVQFPGDGQIYCDAVTSSGDKKPKVFSYNVVFEPNATQEDILQYSGIKNLIEMAVEGFSCTAFCYGQTGSGKTHTLTGPPRLVSVDTSFHRFAGATNVWMNPNAAPSPVYSFSKHTVGSGVYRSAGSMPEKVQKELDKRRIVGSYNNIAETYKDKSNHRRHNSWDNDNRPMISPEQRISSVDVNQHAR